MPWRRSKKLSHPRGGSPPEACARHSDRGVVPGRDAGRPEEQTHLSLGQEGSRPRATHDQRTQSTYLFNAVRPERGTGAALVLPACNSEAMQLHLDEIATKVTPGAHAIVLLDQACRHGGKVLKVPSNMSLMPLPPRAPELNGQENIWQFMRQNWLSNRVFKSFDDIVDHCCFAWNTLISRGKSYPSPTVIGRPWVTQCEDWYKAPILSLPIKLRSHQAPPAQAAPTTATAARNVVGSLMKSAQALSKSGFGIPQS